MLLPFLQDGYTCIADLQCVLFLFYMKDFTEWKHYKSPMWLGMVLRKISLQLCHWLNKQPLLNIFLSLHFSLCLYIIKIMRVLFFIMSFEISGWQSHPSFTTKESQVEGLVSIDYLRSSRLYLFCKFNKSPLPLFIVSTQDNIKSRSQTSFLYTPLVKIPH